MKPPWPPRRLMAEVERTGWGEGTMWNRSICWAVTLGITTCGLASASTPGASAGSPSRMHTAAPVSASAPPAQALRLDTYVRSVVAREHFSGVIRITRGDRLLWTKAYGEACREWRVSNTLTTAFRIGSISKQFTAAAILLLQDAGRLSVQDSLGHWLPDAPAAWRPITIHQLLTHTSGIPDLVRLPEFGGLVTKPTTLVDELQLLAGKPLEHDPGAETRYGNSGYLVAARIVELASGMPFERYLQEHVYQPMQMGHSGPGSIDAIVRERALGYAWRDGSWAVPTYIDMTVPIGAGAEVSSAPDLDRYLGALFGGRLLSAASLALMCTDHGAEYGYGWEVTRVQGRRVIQHTGDINGFGAHVSYFPAGAERIIVLANTEGVNIHAMSDSLAALVFGGTGVGR